ncbi:hypothetical protein EFS13_10795 [Lentilactobacillus buchneri]|uniref:hypothetical protein n=1 Tax=Lentilactobacillus buchneri TaxID=1581 RepID=UPI0021A2BB3A|nr:hypothetical protein [Lentilactobacillus buchneri]MCT3556018.1 hypothetical protein [Lentilactobacillus buchneri]
MNKDKLLAAIKLKGKRVSDVIKSVNNMGVSMSNSTFYKGLRDIRPFKADEIMALSKVLDLNSEDVMDIFFAEPVS